jgi:hypothetical protein
MYQVNSLPVVEFSSPANCRITIKGRLDKRFSDNFGGLEIRNLTAENNTQISYLEGKISDQAALLGCLNSLYNMRFPILTVEVLEG